MNQCFPNFHEDGFSVPASFGFSNPKMGSMFIGDEEIMELLWRNGQVVVQTQKSLKKRSPLRSGDEVLIPAEDRKTQAGGEETAGSRHLSSLEDEMASWLQSPVHDSTTDCDFYADFLNPAPHVAPDAAVSPPRHSDVHPSRFPTRAKCETANLVLLDNYAPEAAQVAAAIAEPTVSSSPSCSGASFSASLGRGTPPKNPYREEGRKRKGREAEDGENAEFGGDEVATKRGCGSSSSGKYRAAEVHNLSERRRRDRINEKMKTLQELIPRCSKSDKASLLDEAIEYLKSLQLQVQMMSMQGYGTVPPPIQQYMSFMGMNMNMNCPMLVPYPSFLAPGSTLPNPAAAQMSFCFPMTAFFRSPSPDSSRILASNQTDRVVNSYFVHDPSQPPMPNLHHHFLGLHQAQSPVASQNRSVLQPKTTKQLRRSNELGNRQNHQSDRLPDERSRRLPWNS